MDGGWRTQQAFGRFIYVYVYLILSSVAPNIPIQIYTQRLLSVLIIGKREFGTEILYTNEKVFFFFIISFNDLIFIRFAVLSYYL